MLQSAGPAQAVELPIASSRSSSRRSRRERFTRERRESTLLDEWLAHLDSLDRSPVTLNEYRRLAERVVKPELGHLRLSKLTTHHLDLLYEKLAGALFAKLSFEALDQGDEDLGLNFDAIDEWNIGAALE